jgi:uncharacterized protein DUF3800
MFMYLAYADDSGTRDRGKNFQLMCAVIIEDKRFTDMEILLAAAAETLIPADKMDKFEEFHAWELFGGYGPFDGIDQSSRFQVIEALLTMVGQYQFPIVYGAVDKNRLAEKVFGSADPLDVCFRICMEGIEDWIGKILPHELSILIVDEFQQKDKAILRKSFRSLRKQIRPYKPDSPKIWHFHDDMYFGASKDSIGIQLADLCGYFIAKHLENDVSAEGFYGLIKDRIVYSRIEPQLQIEDVLQSITK